MAPSPRSTPPKRSAIAPFPVSKRSAIAPFPVSKRSAIAPFHVMEVMRAAEERERAGHHVLHLEVGQPSTPAPGPARAAVAAALETELMGYTGALGTAELREAISHWYRDRYGLAIPADRIVATTGASGSCVLAFLALWDTGARVGVIEPGYPCYRNDLEAFGIEAVGIPVGPDTDYRPTIDLLEAAGPLDGLVIASPSNPTGTLLRPDDLAALADWSRATGTRLVVDEIYHGITYGNPATSALAVDDPDDPGIVVFNSFSKYFSMTGWRLGWIVAPPALVPTLERLAQNLTVAPPTVSQIAGLAAFAATDELDANVARYARNREILLQGLPRAGLGRFAPPDGAFYLWVEVDHLLGPEVADSQALCAAWLAELGIAATPGIDFDPVRGSRFVRFSYARSEDDMRQAVDRLVQWSQNH